jgi:hypothetical protein
MHRAGVFGGVAVATLVVVAACVDEPSAVRRPSASVTSLCLNADGRARTECISESRAMMRHLAMRAGGYYDPSSFDPGTRRERPGGVIELASDGAYRGRTFPLVPQTLTPLTEPRRVSRTPR